MDTAATNFQRMTISPTSCTCVTLDAWCRTTSSRRRPHREMEAMHPFRTLWLWHTGLLTPTASDGSCAMGRLITRGLSSRTDINGDHLASRIGRWCLVELRARTPSPRLARVHRTWVTERYLFLLGLSFLGFIWKISYPCHGAQLTDTYSRPYTGAVRLEHQFYALGQACANACDIALLNSLAMQDVPYVALQERLLSQGVILDETSGGVPSFPDIRAQLISQSPD